MPATNELLQEGVSANGFASAGSDGDTLDELLKRNNRAFPISDVLTWADQLLDALGTLHKGSPAVVHQNVHPENIVLSPDGTVRLLAPNANRNGATGDAHLRFCPLEQIWDGLDAASQKVITNSYDERSEKILKSPLDARSDLYSLAATLYYLLTATQPVDPLERCIEMLDGNSDPLIDPVELNTQVPGEVSKVLLKALEIKRENRFDSAAIMRQVLRSSSAKVKGLVQAQAVDHAEADAKAASLLAEQRREAEQLEGRQREAEELERQQRAAEELERQRRESEEQRRREEAEKAAAEERARLEMEAGEMAKSDASSEPEMHGDELLELDISIMPNVESHISAAPEESEAIELSVVDDVPSPVTTRREHTSGPYSQGEKEFTYEEASTGNSVFSVPVMASAAVVLVLVVVGIYFVAFSGSSKTAPAIADTPPAPVQTAPAPAPVSEPAPSNTDQTATYSATEPQPASTQAAESVRTDTAGATKTAVKPIAGKDAKTPAAKTPQKEKKPVTADDLINDNN